ncbi:MAG: rhomboid family intramembrane serine protease [Hyphomonadaceae bacterium]
MTDTLPAETPARSQPIFNAPLLVIVVAVVLVLLHAAFAFAPPLEQMAIQYDYALAPQRFWAPAGSPDVYPDAAAGLLTLLSSGLLHADWLHVLVNSLMLLALGTPVARALGTSIAGAAYWLLLFVVSVLAGSALYLALANVGSPYLIGASGGVSGRPARRQTHALVATLRGHDHRVRHRERGAGACSALHAGDRGQLGGSRRRLRRGRVDDGSAACARPDG